MRAVMVFTAAALGTVLGAAVAAAEGFAMIGLWTIFPQLQVAAPLRVPNMVSLGVAVGVFTSVLAISILEKGDSLRLALRLRTNWAVFAFATLLGIGIISILVGVGIKWPFAFAAFFIFCLLTAWVRTGLE